VIPNCGKRCRSIIQQIFACRMNLARLLLILISAATVDSVALVTAETKSAGEYQVKAAFLYNFAKFVEWPPNAFSDPKQPMGVCIYGRDPFGRALEDALFGKFIGDRPVILGRAIQFQDLAGCQVVFVSASEREPAADLANRLKGRAVLLVGESEGFAASGGTIQFTIEDSRVRFVINPDAADRAGLKISSKLLALAKIVRDSSQSAAGSALK
jgi:YfiR/HmsC-like